MALPNLASGSDLSARGVTATSVHTVMLGVASAIVRGAAASPIGEADSVVTLTGWGDRMLRLPGLPVQSVSAVEIDGTATDDYEFVDASALWRRCGWGHVEDPTSVTVTMTHGLPAVPVDIVQLVCDLAILGANAAADGALDPRVVAEKVDDYSVTFAEGADAVASAMELPRATRLALRARFGGGVEVVTYR